MGMVSFRWKLAAIFVALSVLLAGPIHAAAEDGAAAGVKAMVSDHPGFAPTCHAASGEGTSIRAMARNGAWVCDDRTPRADLPVAWLRFDAESWAGEERPRHFFTRTARHQAIAFAALDADGTLRTRSFTEAEARPLPAGPIFALPLPEIREETRALIVRVERPHSVPLLSEARLIYDVEDAGWSEHAMMLLAMVIGMLILPLFFDLSFFVVLREKFVALHAGMVLSMMTYVLFAGGLISVFWTLPVAVGAVIGPLSYAMGCGLSALFLAEFLERDAQSPAMRRLMVAVGVWTILVPGFFSLQWHATQAIDDRGYFLAMLVAAFFTSFAILRAMWRGSRSARYLALGWFPLIAASIERSLRGLGLYVGPSSLDQMLYVATGIEVIVMSLAIADRFLALRRERDAALTEARMLEQLSSRDALTGLMNRRALESRFGELLAQGFDTFALVDLDRFKYVNDRYGHQAGDGALIACAAALSGNDERDAVAARLGGEEFVVLLRGKRALERAENLRRAIPLRIASEVPGLDQPVTASMGVIELPRASAHALTFEDFYSRADTLMYEAKASGRNRMSYEKLTMFDSAPLSRAEAMAETGTGLGAERTPAGEPRTTGARAA
ncbi:diguanylate cyclase (GGDEF) domain-containing protein [Erythrobacter sp. HL-111]|nr:MAG: GGDEF domain protein [Erythrobacteraceae bacterium HL-111]SDS86829.1 diguanylate cyclase (GGDEF) domain-containing protein [Erythrobacter sp. HL-111]